MKSRAIYIITGLMMVLGSCKKDLLKTNTNPTTTTADNYNANFLLTTTQLMYTGSSDFGAENWQGEWCEIAGFIQHTASTNTSFYSGDKYLNSVGNFGVYFTHAYIYQVQPVVELYQLTLTKEKFRNLHQMARIMKAMVFERITDLYGDIPYFQAGQGYYNRIYTPVFDKQQDIYADLLKEVSEATDSLDVNADYPTGDVFYSASGTDQINQWKKFGNTLLLRMAMRLTKIDPETAKSYVTKVQGQTMASNNDNAIVEHSPGTLTQNRDAWSILEEDSADLKLCRTYIDTLKNNNDPRLPVMAEIFATGSTDPADQLGLPPGYILGGTNPLIDITQTSDYPAGPGMQGYSRFNDNILSYTAPNLVLTYAESEFLLADAAKRWGIGGSAEEHYKNGVLAAITQLSAFGDASTISDGDAETYYDAHPYNDAIGLSQINTQFWLCTVMNEYEAWCNWRRTGYPQLTPTKYPGNVTNGTIPRRLEYPTSEKVTNQVNYNDAVSRLQGGDLLTSRMWWDAN
ncbi:MAG TPA: SusD/RagB family nutrient-binding outer membrane lipoprotein [Puia sp.]|nr:SusD/RagB family nutrient-binding outer membrane lipoprotein [Puia sp.]